MVSVGFGFLMVAVLVPGSAQGSAICLALAAAANPLSFKFEAGTVVAAGLGAAAIGLGTQSALQAVLAGIAVVFAIVAKSTIPDWRDAQKMLLALVVGSVIALAAALIPLNIPWLALASPVLVVLLFAAVLSPVLTEPARMKQ